MKKEMNVLGIDVELSGSGEGVSTYALFSLNGSKHSEVEFKKVEGNLLEQARYIADVIDSKKPIKTAINTRGFGIALQDTLIKELKTKEIQMNEDGDMFYKSS